TVGDGGGRRDAVHAGADEPGPGLVQLLRPTHAAGGGRRPRPLRLSPKRKRGVRLSASLALRAQNPNSEHAAGGGGGPRPLRLSPKAQARGETLSLACASGSKSKL